ncbi:S1C family serine protease [Cohnella panacarvi]|uniref:S1C family serine protease n=1 Tax=Cohnella panacarvi TaxID=400776 RepID=UPI0004B1AF5A|nr:trypsin-like peptidase domain-containing protein [Cohnella panacarvi]
MSLFKDDFYSTRVSKRSRLGDRRGSRFSGGGMRQGSALRVALISSLASSAFVLILFLTLSGGGNETQVSKPAITGTQTLVETSERIIAASEKVRPAVVSIINMTENALKLQDEDVDWTDEEYIPENASLGSGVIFKKENGLAYIITNAHVIQDSAQVQAVLVDGKRKDATIVGHDLVTDLAVLSVDDEGIDTVVEIGKSEKLRVGEMVIAIGNPLGFGDTLTQGIVSSTHRIIPVSLNQDGNYDWEQEVIQTDAAINQGNSGGALIDLNGKLVGINSMKVAEYGVEGIGFAIPIDDAMPILSTLLEDGEIVRPYMGVYTMDLAAYLDSQPDEEEAVEDEEDEEYLEEEEDGAFEDPAPELPKDVKNGVIVLEAVGPAKAAGLEFNDVIVELDGHPIKSTMDLRKYLYKSKKIGESLTVTYYRDGKKSELTVQLAEKEEEE